MDQVAKRCQTALCLLLALPATAAIVRAQGSVVGWGDNSSGQLTPPAELSRVLAIAGGWSHILALRSGGTVAGWGDNSSGQATPPAGLSGVVGIAAGRNHSLALKSDGTVIGWGDNSYKKATSPSGLSGVVAIAAGESHSLALKSDGTVVGWGYNGLGAAAPPAGLGGAVGIAADASHSLALKSDGTVVGWGFGQVTPPAGLGGVVVIAAGENHSLALKSDGTVVGWGDNSYGQATPPAGLNGVVAIAAGGSHSLALKSDGTVVGWGDNTYGKAEPPAWLRGVSAVSAGAGFSVALDSATANLTLLPRSGSAGNSMTATGSGFLPGEPVAVAYPQGTNWIVEDTGTADSSGSVTVTARVPMSPYGVIVFYASGRSSRRYGHGTFSIVPGVVANPKSGTAGSTVAVQGYGFGVNETVRVYWWNTRSFLGSVTTDERGTFAPLEVTIPAGAPPGTNEVFGQGLTTSTIGRGYVTVE